MFIRGKPVKNDSVADFMNKKCAFSIGNGFPWGIVYYKRLVNQHWTAWDMIISDNIHDKTVGSNFISI